MAKDKTSLGDRMKGYENINRNHLISRMPVVLRLDGKTFHSFCKGFNKPFDEVMVNSMQATMKYLCENIQGCVFGYTQSDEITLVLVDYQELNTSSWFDNNIQKMVSVSASMATWKFMEAMNNFKFLSNERNPDVYDKALGKGAFFDCRAFNVPREDLLNCILWRIKDCARNSKQSLGQAHFSQKQLHKKSADEVVAMVEEKTGIVWENLPSYLKYGTFCFRRNDSEFVVGTKNVRTYGDLESIFTENNIFF